MAPKLFQHQFGSGPERVLALHCTIAHGGAWRGVAAALGADKVTLTAPDFLSHGQSPDWDETGDFPTVMTQAFAPMLQNGRTHLLGHSFGAVLALWLAKLYPERVQSLTLVEPVFFAVAAQDDAAALARHDTDAEPFVQALRSGDLELGARLFNRMWSDGSMPRWPDMSARTRSALVRGIHIVLASNSLIYGDRPGLLTPSTLSDLKMPVGIVLGGESHPILTVVAEGLAHRIGRSEIAIVPGAGHMVPISHPGETARIIAQTMKRAKS
ncbi:MAG: alpha/beta fold hydrolase [Paracoccaceae bacterium]